MKDWKSEAQSPVELSLNPLFHRRYSSLHDAVDNFLVPASSDKEKEERIEHQQNRMRIVFGHCPKPVMRNFLLFAIDTTGVPRPFADTLMDRGINYHLKPAIPILGLKKCTSGSIVFVRAWHSARGFLIQ